MICVYQANGQKWVKKIATIADPVNIANIITRCQQIARNASAGKYSQISGATSCTDCSRNTFTNKEGASKCGKCVGIFMDEKFRVVLCSVLVALVGETFPSANMTGGNCEKCMKGRYSLIAGEPFPGCHECPSGR